MTEYRLLIEVKARRWFQKTYGNTYHSCRVAIYKPGKVQAEFTGSAIFEYGYGSQYLQTAGDIIAPWFTDHGIEFPENGLFDWKWKEENQILVKENVIDVDRKKIYKGE